MSEDKPEHMVPETSGRLLAIFWNGDVSMFPIVAWRFGAESQVPQPITSVCVAPPERPGLWRAVVTADLSTWHDERGRCFLRKEDWLAICRIREMHPISTGDASPLNRVDLRSIGGGLADNVAEHERAERRYRQGYVHGYSHAVDAMLGVSQVRGYTSCQTTGRWLVEFINGALAAWRRAKNLGFDSPPKCPMPSASRSRK